MMQYNIKPHSIPLPDFSFPPPANYTSLLLSIFSNTPGLCTHPWMMRSVCIKNFIYAANTCFIRMVFNNFKNCFSLFVGRRGDLL